MFVFDAELSLCGDVFRFNTVNVSSVDTVLRGEMASAINNILLCLNPTDRVT